MHLFKHKIDANILLTSSEKFWKKTLKNQLKVFQKNSPPPYIYNLIYITAYVCMYVCMYVRMYVCMYVCMYVRTYVRTYVCMYLFAIIKPTKIYNTI